MLFIRRGHLFPEIISLFLLFSLASLFHKIFNSYPAQNKNRLWLYLGYGENITITEGATIGNNVNINHGAAIGIMNRGNKKGAPIIGDCVWIGTNAVVVGNITIGNNVLIAPLSHVNFDVPENAVVAGNPAKIISYKGTEGYINKKWIG